jgi:hypothetical protein
LVVVAEGLAEVTEAAVPLVAVLVAVLSVELEETVPVAEVLTTVAVPVPLDPLELTTVVRVVPDAPVAAVEEGVEPEVETTDAEEEEETTAPCLMVKVLLWARIPDEVAAKAIKLME